VPADGQWHFVAVSVNHQAGISVQFTLHSTLTSSVVVTSPARNGSLANSSDVRLGMITIGNGSVFNGSIDEVEFFHRAVSVNEWQTIINARCYGKCPPQ
jgi:hypothetical protein